MFTRSVLLRGASSAGASPRPMDSMNATFAGSSNVRSGPSSTVNPFCQNVTTRLTIPSSAFAAVAALASSSSAASSSALEFSVRPRPRNAVAAPPRAPRLSFGFKSSAVPSIAPCARALSNIDASRESGRSRGSITACPLDAPPVYHSCGSGPFESEASSLRSFTSRRPRTLDCERGQSVDFDVVEITEMTTRARVARRSGRIARARAYHVARVSSCAPSSDRETSRREVRFVTAPDWNYNDKEKSR